jgi:hypothetical protein
MVPKSKSTRNSDLRHKQSIGRQRQAAQRAQAEVSAEDLTAVLPPDELPMLPDSELVATTSAAPSPELQRAVMSAGQYVQHPYEGTVPPQRCSRPEKGRGYVWHHYDIVRHYTPLLGAGPMGLYLYLASYAENRTQSCFPKMQTIAEGCRLSEPTARKYLADLAEHKLVGIERRFDAQGRQTSHQFTLLDPLAPLKTPAPVNLSAPQVLGEGKNFCEYLTEDSFPQKGEEESSDMLGLSATTGTAGSSPPVPPLATRAAEQGGSTGSLPADTSRQGEAGATPLPTPATVALASLPATLMEPEADPTLASAVTEGPTGEAPQQVDVAVHLEGLDVLTRSALETAARQALKDEGVAEMFVIKPVIEQRMLELLEAGFTPSETPVDPAPAIILAPPVPEADPAPLPVPVAMAEPVDDLAPAAVASDLERANGRQGWRLLRLLDPAEVAKTQPDAALAGVDEARLLECELDSLIGGYTEHVHDLTRGINMNSV